MQKQPWMPREFIYEFTDEDLTSSAGLGPLIDLFCASPQFAALTACLPERKSNAAFDTTQFALALLSGFWYGHDCLDDLEEFDGDPSVEEKLEELPSARAVGDWLRDFSPEHIEKLNQFLTKQAFSCRKQLSDAPLNIDMDSTAHEQCGQKMEGLAFNYDGKWCLDSLVGFDELGLSYRMDLRPGSTFSSVGASPMIDAIFSNLEFKAEKHFRADSAFCNEEVIRSCLAKGAKFTITAHGNTAWENQVPDITSWVPWQYSTEEQNAAAAKKREIPLIELGSFFYQPGWSENLRFPCVVKRTWVEKGEDLFGSGHWKYYAVLTNRNLLTISLQAILEHHAKRGNSENFIREEKYGYDLKHFPCQKLSANHAYGLFALIAHNFLRTIARLHRPDKPHYAKKLRRRFIFIPGKLVKHARQLVMKIPRRFQKEVALIREWTRAATSLSALARGT